MSANNVVVVQLRAAAFDSDSTAASADLDLGPYVNAGKKEIIGVWTAIPASASSDTDGTYDNAFYESATTVNSDFSAISGASFTQVLAESTAATEMIKFVTNQRYIRSAISLGGTAATLYDITTVILQPRFDT